MEYFYVLVVCLLFWYFCGKSVSIKDKFKDLFMNVLTLVLFANGVLLAFMLRAVSDDLQNKTYVCEESGGVIYNARCYERNAVETLLNSEIKLEKIENEK